MDTEEEEDYEYEEYEEDWDEEEFEDEEREPSPRSPDGLTRSVSLGLLGMAPMFLVYELALASTESRERNTSELVLFRAFELFGEAADIARWVALSGAFLFALVYCLRRNWALGPRVLRIAAEGALGAIAIGPVLIGLIHLLGDAVPPLPMAADGTVAPTTPGLSRAAFVFGAGAYEELVFRVGAYSALYVAALHVGGFLFGAGKPACRPVAELIGLLGSAALFSAFHLAVFVRWLGPGGEEFDLALFEYRALAGILLGLIFRFRGPGVAAWTHGLFNVALLLGAGPNVFL